MTHTRTRAVAAAVTLLFVASALTVVPVVVLAAEEAEPNDSRENANPVEPGTEIDGEIATEDDEDWFSFRAERGETVTVTIEVPSDAPGRPYFEVRNASGTMGDSAAAYGNPGDTKVIGFTVERTGTYYLRGYYDTGSYSVTVDSERTDAFEPNDDRDAAVPYTLGTRQRGEVTVGDDDWFTFDATRGETIVVNASVASDAPGRPYFEFHNASGSIDGAGAYGAPGETKRIGTTVRQSGTHYLRVYYDRGPYSFTARTITTDPFEPNERAATARRVYHNPVTPNEAQVSVGDVDWFAVRADAGEQIRVSGASESGDVYAEFRSESTDLNGTYLRSGESNVATFTPSSAGTYLLRIYYDTGHYEFDLTVGGEPVGLANDRFERPNPPLGNQDRTNATELGPGEYRDLRIVDDDRDVFAVDLTTDRETRAAISFDHAENDLALALTDASGETLERVDTDTDGETLAVTPPTDGTYYLVVTGESGAATTYDLDLSGAVGSADPDTGYGSGGARAATVTTTAAGDAGGSEGTETDQAGTSTVTEEDGRDGDGGGETDGQGTPTTGQGAGFGVIVSLIALLGTGLWAHRR